ncbi:peptide chain release factor N(5)-glutamine methyltransferase [Paenibacillus allorhizosphaerae]|uniref:Release factor glutamine methyltransferase n=1 Tax=Paenibacillus allorhizosphaerae TaxID=2849866 RepID=A0ABM8VRS2_9BACL|nr:peptide chain release factor N(5)-glutamine methyltransferase [Paenibacillus allorhizosphaerae]CAG7655663.1 Release factor glutamine methyltransferase [Paenibacillus allorhizosphaerae]
MSDTRRLTIREAYAEASSFLRQRGVREPEANAQRLLEHLLGEDRSGLLLRWPEPFPQEREADWQRLLERKASGEPVQYMIGEQEFYGLPFAVTPAVLIPRPETELLVEAVVTLGRRLWETGARKSESPVVCDVGTGSGAIAVSLAVQRPEWRVLASDISPDALKVAEANAARNGMQERIAFMEGDLLVPYIERGIKLDAVVSNPPYIPEEDEAGLQPEVRLYEPRTALYGGVDGLVLYRRLTSQLAELPALPSLVGFEVGQGQAGEVRRLLEQAADWDEVRVIPDLAGIERHVIAYRKPSLA